MRKLKCDCNRPDCKICYHRNRYRRLHGKYVKDQSVNRQDPAADQPARITTFQEINKRIRREVGPEIPVFLEVIDTTRLGLKIDLAKEGRTARVLISTIKQDMDVHKIDIRSISTERNGNGATQHAMEALP